MRNTSRRRPLAFEQMEQRLALSAAPLSDFVLTLGSDWRATQAFGGSVSFDQVLTADVSHTRGTFLSFSYDNFAADNGFVNIVDGNFIFAGPIFSKPDVEGPLESNEAGSLVTPIPQPQIGNDEIAEGIIAVAEIFRPTQSLPTTQVAQPLVENAVVETTVARAADNSWKSISLSRGRDMYFEVAAISDEHATSGEKDTELSSEITPLIYKQALLRRETERASATTAQERANSVRQLPPLPAAPQQEAQPADAKHSEVPANDAAVEKTQRTAQEDELPKDDELSQVDDPRDHVFAIWNSDDELSEEAIALRAETQQGHSATWPVLAALAATGWMARTRRSTGVLPRHRQPLPRK